MKNKFVKSTLSLILALSFIFSFSAYFTVFAAEKKGVISGASPDVLRVRKGPGTNYDRVAYNGENTYLYDGDEVIILQEVKASADDTSGVKTWYEIRFTFKNVTLTGYVASKYVKVIDESSVEMPNGVPKEYESYIKTLLSLHPNWKFVFYDTKTDWSDLFKTDAEGYLGRSLIPNSSPLSYRSTQDGAYSYREDKWIAQDSGTWFQANSQTIAYYMDPRNFLNEKNVFMFEQLSFDRTTHNINGVQDIIKGSFMDNVNIKNQSNNNVSYVQTFMDAADYSNVSPYHLASRVIQEVGMNGSGSTSGVYSGYEGYYNFYNINATQGERPIANGLNYAKNGGSDPKKNAEYLIPWNSQYKSIVGGAKWIGNGYINVGQDTLYYQKFNTAKKVYYHQYMGNIMAPSSESVKIFNSYNSLGIINNAFTFIIPYYRNMPASACKLPASNNYSPNNWLKSLTVNGNSIGFDGAKTSGYSITVPAASTVNISAVAVNSKAKISGAGNVTLKDTGTTTVNITVTAENGDKRTYSVNITKSEKIPMTGISLSASSLSMFVGQSQTLNVSFTPSNTTDSKTVIWSTSNPSVATVSNGKVTATGEGTATIKAKVGTFEKTCTVTVKGSYKLGDVDADGNITIADALMIFKYKTGEVKLSELALLAADTDKNGEVSIADALRIFKFKSGEISQL